MKWKLTILIYIINLACLISVAAVALSSCKKNGNKARYTVKGVLYNSCGDVVPSAKRAILLEYFTRSILDESFELELSTNDKGEFEAVYEELSDVNSGSLNVSYRGMYTNNEIVTYLPQNTNVDLGNIYQINNANYIIRIKTPRPYTSEDTLFFNIPNYPSMPPFVVGPFTDGQAIDTITKSAPITCDKTSGRPMAYVECEWKVGIKYFDPNRQNRVIATIEPCLKNNDVVIDLAKSVK